MKKAIVVLSALFVMVYGEHDVDGSMPICMNWKDSLNMHWQSLSDMHKCALMCLAGVAVLWGLWRLVKCSKGSCGCHCGDTCTCKRS